MHTTAMMCLILKVSECGYYAWRKRPVSKRAMADALVTKRIRAIHEMSDGTYGAPRIRAELADVDRLKMSTKRIFRLMKCQRLQGVSGRRFVTTTVRDEKARKSARFGETPLQSEKAQCTFGRRHYLCTHLGRLSLLYPFGDHRRRR